MAKQQVHHYDPATGAYAGSSEAAHDPLEHHLACIEAGELVEPSLWLVPANATLEPPPALEDGQVAVFHDGAWSAVTPAAPPAPEPRAERTWSDHRRWEYGPIAEQLDRLYHQLKDAGIPGPFTDHIDAVKAAHPKPEA